MSTYRQRRQLGTRKATGESINSPLFCSSAAADPVDHDATWFLLIILAQTLGAQIAKLTASETVGGQVLDQCRLADYVKVFEQIGWGAIGHRHRARRGKPVAEKTRPQEAPSVSAASSRGIQIE